MEVTLSGLSAASSNAETSSSPSPLAAVSSSGSGSPSALEPSTLGAGLNPTSPALLDAAVELLRCPSVSGLMAVLIIGIVTAANAARVTADGSLLLVVTAAALLRNLIGYTAGWMTSWSFDGPERIAATLSVGMRDFAVAAALLVVAGFPSGATLPAVVFGIIEMTTSAGLAKWLARN